MSTLSPRSLNKNIQAAPTQVFEEQRAWISLGTEGKQKFDFVLPVKLKSSLLNLLNSGLDASGCV